MPQPRRPDVAAAYRRRQAFWWGVWAEWVAMLWLILKGYRIVAWRVRTPAGEIDVLATPWWGLTHTLVVVEVKARATYAEALEAITISQRKHLIMAAAYVVGEKNHWHRAVIRFDAVLLVPHGLPRHMPHAWIDETPGHVMVRMKGAL